MPNVIQQYVSGPADLFVGTGADGALECLGFSEDDVRLEPGFPIRPVRTSMSGEATYDNQYMGLTVRCSIRLNLYDEEVLVKLMTVLGQGSAGSIPANSIGTLLRQEGKAPRLLVRSRYGAGQPGAAAHPTMDRMIPCFNFPAAHLVGQMACNIGTNVRMWQAAFEAIPLWNPIDGSAVVWNFDTAGIPTYGFLQNGQVVNSA